MAIQGNRACAVPGCTAPISGPNNLCEDHRLPGAQIRIGGSTMVVTAWYAEHGDEVGMIILNDFALGELGGGGSFEAKLREQGFSNVRNLATPEEVEAAKRPAAGKRVGAWAGPWKTKYSWEILSPIVAQREEISNCSVQEPGTVPHGDEKSMTADLREFPEIETKMVNLPPDTHSDEELMSPEFRAGVEALKKAIRIAFVAQGDLDIGTYWAALHELGREILLADKGEEEAEMYRAKLMEFTEWLFAHEGFPLEGSAAHSWPND
jgi:hypothetical protein